MSDELARKIEAAARRAGILASEPPMPPEPDFGPGCVDIGPSPMIELLEQIAQRLDKPATRAAAAVGKPGRPKLPKEQKRAAQIVADTATHTIEETATTFGVSEAYVERLLREAAADGK